MFEQFTTAFVPQQIEESYAHDGIGAVPDIKGADGNWDTRGHRGRVMRIDRDALSVIHALSEDETVPVEEARFIQPFSTSMLDVFRKMSRFPKLDTAIGNASWQMSAHWHETSAQKDGTIKRQTGFRPADEMILQGPHFHVGNPLYKTARKIVRTKADYDVIDLTRAADDYLPRTNYGPAIEKTEYRRRMTRCRWDSTKTHADFYRIAFRAMVNLNSERSLVNALLPQGAAHVNSVESIAFSREEDVVVGATLFVSLPIDFYLKASGKQNLHDKDVKSFPWLDAGATAQHRTLRLACLTTAYADLWNRNIGRIQVLPWSSTDPRLVLEGPVQGPAKWNRTAGLRTEFARRMALVEIDVLVAQALSLTLDQLIEIYRIYFPVLQENEDGTWYDQKGRIVWSCSKGLPGVGWLDQNRKRPGRAAWEKMLAENPVELTCTVIDDTQPGGAREITRHFVGPFTKCNRIEDYRCAWPHFERVKVGGAA